MVEKFRGYTYKITYMSTVHYRRLQNLVPNSSWDIAFWPKMIKYTNQLIWIFKNINEHLRNKRKIVEK